MFGRKKRNKKKMLDRPMGVKLRIQLNLATIQEVAKTGKSPSISEMIQTWDKCNYVHREFGVAVVNSLDNKILVFCGADAKIYRDLIFDIALPYPVGPNKTEHLELCSFDDIFCISIDGIPLMVFPASNIIGILTGNPLLDTGRYTDMWGEKEEISAEVIMNGIEYSLPMIARVADKCFSYQNRAININSTLLLSDDFDAKDLSMKDR